jgi:hypothetical protein
MEITKIKNRNDVVEEFDRARIEKAIEKACATTGVAVSSRFYSSVTDDVTNLLDQQFFERIPGVQDVEEVVEMTLADRGLFEAAKAYTLSRKKHANIHNPDGFFENGNRR